MATTPSLKVIKKFTYRGTTRNYSNRYHFNGGTPANGTAWTTFSDAVVNAEKLALSNGYTGHQIIGTVGYAAGSDVPVFSKTYTTAAAGGFASEVLTPGEVAALIRYATTARTTKNHPVYLFNYYHCASGTTGTNPDTLNAAQKTAMTTYANAWLSGFSDGTNTLVRAGPRGATATGVFVEPNLTHRDFPK